VWRALTEPDQLVEWLAEAELEPAQGGRVVLRWLNTDTEGRHTVANGTITRWEPPRVVEYATDVHGRLRWELEPMPDGCRLLFTSVLDRPDYTTLEALAGWHVHLVFLAEALDGQRVDWPYWPLHRWEALHEHYQAEGASAGRQG
jgi:uncharacterized protein YndB with AHSA1/START domain